jgi:hypothetical protein
MDIEKYISERRGDVPGDSSQESVKGVKVILSGPYGNSYKSKDVYVDRKKGEAFRDLVKRALAVEKDDRKIIGFTTY